MSVVLAPCEPTKEELLRWAVQYQRRAATTSSQARSLDPHNPRVAPVVVWYQQTSEYLYRKSRTFYEAARTM